MDIDFYLLLTLYRFKYATNFNLGGTEQRFLPEDWDHFHILLEQMLYRIPSLGNAILEKLCNGPEAFSPDCKWIVGEAPEIRNYYIAAGMKTVSYLNL